MRLDEMTKEQIQQAKKDFAPLVKAIKKHYYASPKGKVIKALDGSDYWKVFKPKRKPTPKEQAVIKQIVS